MPTLAGAFLGLSFMVGLLLILRRRKPSVAGQVLPFVRATGFDWTPARKIGSGFAYRRFARYLDVLVSDDSVRQRLTKARSPLDLEMFRLDQLRWAAGALGIVVALGLVRASVGKPISPTVWLLCCAAAAISAAFLRDVQLTRDANRRIERLSKELPVFAELLAFTVAAGLAPASALNRVASKVGGELSIELRMCGDEVAAGRPFTHALEAMADRVSSVGVRRFVDGIVVAMERGTPIADVLRAQAMDARSASHRELMENASKREILALVPVVFLVLPVVVVVAVYPGVVGLVV